MAHIRATMRQHLAERVCWQVARRDEHRIARRRDRQPVVEGVYRWAEGARLDDVWHVLQAHGVMAWREPVHGPAIQRTLVPGGP